MKKCICCGKQGAEYKHYNGGYVCDKCIGQYFICPDCGIVYDQDDLEHADAGNGFCVKCANRH